MYTGFIRAGFIRVSYRFHTGFIRVSYGFHTGGFHTGFIRVSYGRVSYGFHTGGFHTGGFHTGFIRVLSSRCRHTTPKCWLRHHRLAGSTLGQLRWASACPSPAGGQEARVRVGDSRQTYPTGGSAVKCAVRSGSLHAGTPLTLCEAPVYSRLHVPCTYPHVPCSYPHVPCTYPHVPCTYPHVPCTYPHVPTVRVRAVPPCRRPTRTLHTPVTSRLCCGSRPWQPSKQRVCAGCVGEQDEQSTPTPRPRPEPSGRREAGDPPADPALAPGGARGHADGQPGAPAPDQPAAGV